MKKRDVEKAHPFNGTFLTYDFDAISEILTESPDLLAAWAEYIGVDIEDDRLIAGCWADRFKPFYAGYVARYNAAEKNSEVFREQQKKELHFVPL